MLGCSHKFACLHVRMLGCPHIFAVNSGVGICSRAWMFAGRSDVRIRSQTRMFPSTGFSRYLSNSCNHPRLLFCTPDRPQSFGHVIGLCLRSTVSKALGYQSYMCFNLLCLKLFYNFVCVWRFRTGWSLQTRIFRETRPDILAHLVQTQCTK